ncbi:MAG: hypothetical protein M1608_17515 [Candidatus Omnitrophica bacterium]|nr:hypothetical protein [Candidatus Omnitrophota bacterium]
MAKITDECYANISASKIAGLADILLEVQNQFSIERAEDQRVRFQADRQSASRPEAREDARLLAAIAEGDTHALAALYGRRGGVLYSLLIRVLANQMEAQEAMQDAFVQIWRRAHEYDSERSSPMAWMVMIARGWP